MIILDGRNMTTREKAHAHIREMLSLPEYYGGNLDALWDMASTARADVCLTHAGAMLNALQKYGCKLLSTLYDGAEENPEFTFCVEDEAE